MSEQSQKCLTTPNPYTACMSEYTVETTDDEVMIELAHGVIGRAQDLHDYHNDEDDVIEIAKELRDIGHEILREFR